MNYLFKICTPFQVNLKLLFFLFSQFSFVFLSCNNERYNETLFESASQDPIQKLNPNKTVLSSNDAKSVARMHCEANTRSLSNKIKDVATLYNHEQPLIYVVNLNEGYLLISAERNFYPILATIDHGYFDINNINETSNIVFKDLLESVKIAQKKNDIAAYSSFWDKYLEPDIKKSYSQTRNEYDDYQKTLEDFYNSFSSRNNVTIRLLKRCGNILPENIYNKFVALASEDDFWAGTSYEWSSTAYVVEEITNRSFRHGPLISSTWSQDSIFCEYPDQPLGCVTVAIGQLMKFYRHPDCFNWDDMPNSEANETIRQFLAILKFQLNVDSNGFSNFQNVLAVLNSYGYNADLINHDASRIYLSVKQSKPVFAGGRDEISSIGHAWIIDGIDSSTTDIKYTLYRLSDIHYPDFKYVSVDEGIYNSSSNLVTFHMNFGWGGKHDGWYIDQRIWGVEEGAYKFKFSKDRNELIFK